MKKLLLMLALLASSSFAQLPDSMLTDAQRAYIQAQEAKKASETAAEAAGAWVGVGKELGVAVNESLSALTDNADKLANTRVGTFTMFAVAWKLFAGDIVKVLFIIGITFVYLLLVSSSLVTLFRKSESEDRRSYAYVFVTLSSVLWLIVVSFTVAHIG